MRRPLPRARLLLGAILAVALPLAPPATLRAAPAEAPAVSPDAIKAVFLVNFVTFTEWPEGVPAASSPYLIGISGNRAVEDELIRLADRKLVRGRRLKVVRIKNESDLQGLHVAYFDSAAASQIDALSARDALPLLRKQPILTVSDNDDFIAAGGMIRIFREDKALRFEIAPDTAREAGLTLNSRLLAVARIHRAEPPPPSAPPPSTKPTSEPAPGPKPLASETASGERPPP